MAAQHWRHLWRNAPNGGKFNFGWPAICWRDCDGKPKSDNGAIRCQRAVGNCDVESVCGNGCDRLNRKGAPVRLIANNHPGFFEKG